MAATQSTDPDIRSLQSSQTSTLVVVAVPLANSAHPLYCDTSTGTQRPLVPQSWRRTVFNSLHGLSHPGIRATQKLITSHFVWPGINTDVRRRTRSCIQCQHAKIHRHSTTPLSSFSILCRSCRYCRTSTTITWLYIPPHLCRLLHSLARSHPYYLNYS